MSSLENPELDLFNQVYSDLDMSLEALAHRLETFRLQGRTAQELAVYFFSSPRSRTVIYELYRKLLGKSFHKVKAVRRCIVCEGILSNTSASTRMHFDCRKAFFNKKQRHSYRAREEAFKEIYKKILRS